MANFKFKKKFSWKSTISLVLGVLILAGAVMGLASLHKDTTTISPFAFSVGELDDVTGKYVKSTDAIYTPEAFSAQGLRVTPDFEASDVEYQIFWYDENDRFLGTADDENLTDAYTEQRTLPTSARIVIYPSQLDDEGNLIEDFKVGALDVYGIAKSLTITVDADQDKVFSASLFTTATDGLSAKMEIEDYKSLLLQLPAVNTPNTVYTVTFYAEKTDAEGTVSYKELDNVVVTLQNYTDGEYLWYTIEKIPAGATHATVTYYEGNTNVAVYGIYR